jgi:predicted ribosome quality control (RQC) complex YloA/Tae2 family protein
VVVPLEKKASIGQELLLDAAHLAAHFSKQRGEPTVEIAHTERRFVRKPKGAAAGSVNVDRERVFVLRIERDRLARLLASEKT